MFRNILRSSTVLAVALAIIAVSGAIAGNAKAQELVVYSGRGERLIKPVFDEFSKRTGIKITLHSAGTVELLNRLIAEGNRTRADIYMTVDAGTLERARVAGLLLPVKSDLIEKSIPAAMRAPDNSWAGLSLRIRVIAYNPQKVRPDEIKTFDSLADPKFKGRLGLRTGSNIYPQSHIAMMLAERSESATGKFLMAILANAGDKIYPSDSRAVEAVAKGEVDAAIVNHYYVYGHLRKNQGDSKALSFVVPQKTAYNVSGAGILKTSKNKEAAQKLIEFMASDEGQKLFVEENREYPVNPGLAPHPDMMPRNQFTLSDVTLSGMGRYVIPAIDLIDKVGYR